MSLISRGVWENMRRRRETMASLMSWINSKMIRKPRSLVVVSRGAESNHSQQGRTGAMSASRCSAGHRCPEFCPEFL